MDPAGVGGSGEIIDGGGVILPSYTSLMLAVTKLQVVERFVAVLIGRKNSGVTSFLSFSPSLLSIAVFTDVLSWEPAISAAMSL